MNELHEQAKLFVLQLVSPGLVKREEVETALDQVISMLRARHGDVQFDVEHLVRELEAALNVFQPDSVSLDDDTDHEDWYDQRRKEIPWRFWERFLRYMRESDEPLPPAVLDRLEKSTAVVLRKLEYPGRTGAWDRRGMVVGQIQSGKTGHYTGLLCRAADAGYRLIVVLAGMHNNLRSQTQTRLDEGFLGLDTQQRTLADNDAAFAAAALGVGRLVGAPRLDAASLTTSADTGDFGVKRAGSAGILIGGYPVLLAVKKHRGILDNLREWVVTTHGTGTPSLVRDIPLLLIDDEADNASVNTVDPTDSSGEYDPDVDPSKVNGAIRMLLNAFEKKAYVGYTATPYANIYIPDDWQHPDFGPDLFPRSFIEYLRPPSNYFGPASLFGVDGGQAPLHRRVSDYQTWIPDRHGSGHKVGALPNSVRTAMKSFVLARAARLARGQVSKHNSMLIHVTRFALVQQQVRDQVDEELNDLRGRIRFGDGSGPSIREELSRLWHRDFMGTSQACMPGSASLGWAKVEAKLEESVEPIVVRTINGTARDALEYFENRSTGFNVVAVGGNKLSRGLTLFGLSVSYYLRTSRAYDTLLQMSRWFGYRDGYQDLCRLWCSRSLWSAYGEVTQANEELIGEFEEMAARGLTPSEYGLKVRRSVNGMLVTAPNKMLAGTRLRVGFSGAMPETTVLPCDEATADANFQHADAFVALLRTEYGAPQPSSSGNLIWTGVAGSRVAEDFLAELHTPISAWRVHAPTIAAYIRDRLAAGELTKWTVVLISVRDRSSGIADHVPPSIIGGHSIGLSKRSVLEERAYKVPSGLYSIRRILSPPDELIDLSPEQIGRALEETQALWRVNPGRRATLPLEPSGPAVRRQRDVQTGLLLIYPLVPPDASARVGDPRVTDQPMVGFAISFPRSPNAPAADYLVNKRFLDEVLGAADE